MGPSLGSFRVYGRMCIFLPFLSPPSLAPRPEFPFSHSRLPSVPDSPCVPGCVPGRLARGPEFPCVPGCVSGCVPGRLALALAAPGPSLAVHNYSPFYTPACIPCPSPPSLGPGRKGPFSRQSASTDGKSALPNQVGSQFPNAQNEDLGLLYRSLPSVPPRTSS